MAPVRQREGDPLGGEHTADGTGGDGVQALGGVRLSLERGGNTLVLSKAGRRLAVVDTRTFEVKTLARP